MTTDTRPPSTLRDTMRTGVREASGIWWWFVLLGALWIWFGMFVLSYRVGSLTYRLTGAGRRGRSPPGRR